jgi:enamine deaminase RidA (YjgF/YER057c/UK114 family)
VLVSSRRIAAALSNSTLLAFLSIGVLSSPVIANESAEARLAERHIVLSTPAKPIGNYVEYVRVGNLLYLAGHGGGDKWNGKGKVGRELTVEQGYQAARDVGLNLLATAKAALGNLDRVRRVVRIFGMVNSAPGFGDQPKVINGGSDLMTEVFGETNGRGVRAAVGMAELPNGMPVEMEMILEVK